MAVETKKNKDYEIGVSFQSTFKAITFAMIFYHFRSIFKNDLKNFLFNNSTS